MSVSRSHGSLSSSLLDRLQLHNREAWFRLVELYGPVVYAWCQRAGLGSADSADVTQEVFVAVSRAIATFRRDYSGSTFRGWIATVTRNKIRDHFRKCGTQPVALGGSEMLQSLQNLSFSDDSGRGDPQSVSVERTLLARAVHLVRAEFEDRTWQAFWRTTVSSKLPADVAQELGVSINAVYKARSRVLRRLRDEFEELL